MPLKRAPYLQPLSREHHYGLLLVWKIRTGINKGIDPGRIGAYLHWFSEHYLMPHLEREEQYVYPILGNEHEQVAKALQEHAAMRILLAETDQTSASLLTIAEALETHIRFEERELFGAIQAAASPDQIAILEAHITDVAVEDYADEFWV